MTPARLLSRFALAATLALAAVLPAGADQVAKDLFGARPLPTVSAPKAYGFYSKGCLAGGVALPVDGPTWQAMRLERNRRWGHPRMVALVERLSREGVQDGWPGLLVGDISQPRGGPMLSGHASHQIGLDADIWLTPMPDRRLSRKERADLSATSMLKGDTLYVDPKIWTAAHGRLLKRAAGYGEVERLFVHPGIKKKMCETYGSDAANNRWLGKIRPYYGHHYHFHIRMTCPKDSPGCKGQDPVGAGSGCGKELAWWFTDEPWRPAKPSTKPAKPRHVMMSQLPAACATVLDGPEPESEVAVTYGAGYDPSTVASVPVVAGPTGTAAASAFAPPRPPANIPVPLERPGN